MSLAEATASSDLAESLALADLGFEHGARAGARVECGKALYVKAEALLAAGQGQLALEQARAALKALDAVGYGSGRARSHLVCGEALLSLTDRTGALKHLLEAVRYYKRERVYPHLRVRALDAAERAASGPAEMTLLRGLDRREDIAHLEETQGCAQP